MEAVATQVKYSSEVSVEGQKKTQELCQFWWLSGRNLECVSLEYNHGCSLTFSQNPATVTYNNTNISGLHSSIDWPASQPANQPTKKPNNQPTNKKPNNQLTKNQPTNRPTDRSTDRPTDQVTNRPTKQPTKQPTN